MSPTWRRIRPGWYLLVALIVYATVVTALLRGSNKSLKEARTAAAEVPVVPEPAPPPLLSEESGIWFPIPGAGLPVDDAHLPGAARVYRRGVSQGFDFYDEEVGVPVAYGSAVVAAASGTLVRVDTRYSEISPEAWQALLDQVVEDGADEGQLDRLRGRQVWLRGDDGRVFRYAHLSDVRRGLAEGQRVYRGQVIGFVGNSGTDDGVQGSTRGARLHFEIWDGDLFFGDALDPEAVRLAAASLFTGP